MVADLGRLAGDAVAVVAGHCARVAEGVATRAVDALAEHLWNLLRDRLGGDDAGRRALDGVAEQPGDEQRTGALRDALIEALREDDALAALVEDAVGEARRAGLVDRQVIGTANVTVGRMRQSQISLGPMTISNTRNVRIGVGVAALATLALLIAALRGGDGGSGAETAGDGSAPPPTPAQGDRPNDGSAGGSAGGGSAAAGVPAGTFRLTYGPRDLTGPVGDCGIETAADGSRTAFVETSHEAGQGNVDVEIYYDMEAERFGDRPGEGFVVYDYGLGEFWRIEALQGVDISLDLMTVRARWDDGTTGELVVRCPHPFEESMPGAGA
jgi:hypothetical protein